MSVYNKLLHAKELRLLGGIIGAALMATAINLFIVPQGFYAGGAYGMCQVIRTLLVTRAGLTLPFDLAGLLYLLVNLPMFYLAYRGLGRTFFVKATIVTVCNSIFSALIPSPATPIIEDALTSCLIGGIGVGFAAGLVLSCGCSTGGLDILGLYLSKKNPKFTVGRFCICFNVCLYTLCFILFNATTAIYSAIYNILNNLFLDRLHQQNVNVELLIFTKKNDPELPRFIMDKLARGVLCGAGGYPHRRQLPAAPELTGGRPRINRKHPVCEADLVSARKRGAFMMFFTAPQSDTGACRCFFCRTQWPPRDSGRCTPYSGCNPRPRRACPLAA